MDDDVLLAHVRSERTYLHLPRLDHATARRLGEAAAAEAERDGLPVAIRVVRGTQIAFHASFAGTTAEHDHWVERKINTTIRHEIPSLEFVLRQRVAGRVPDWLDPLTFAVAGGAVPLLVQDQVAGVIAVSGLTTGIAADHDVAMRAVRTAKDQGEQ